MKKTKKVTTKTQAPAVTTPPKRTLPMIQQEYANACGELGQVNFQIENLIEQTKTLSGRLKSLMREGNLIQAEEAAAKAMEAKVEAEKKATPSKSAPTPEANA